VNKPLSFTGERFVPEVRGTIWYEHWHRYSLVQRLVDGKRVLDAACGEGYGSMLLSRCAREVIGIDIDQAAIDHASQRYAGVPGLRYVQGSCTALPIASASIDLVVSFETIEHLLEQEAMLAEFRRVLTADGVLVISSPNRPVYSAGVETLGEHGSPSPQSVNHFHVRELDRVELEHLLSAGFPQQGWYGQRVVSHSMLWSESPSEKLATELLALVDDRIMVPAVPALPMYFLVICGAHSTRLPQLPDLSLFDDGAQSLYRDYERALLLTETLRYDVIDAQKIADERLQQAVTAQNAASSARLRADTLQSRVTDLEAELTRTQQAFGHLSQESAASVTALAETRTRLVECEGRLRYRESVTGWVRWPLSRLRRAPEAHRPYHH